MLPGKSLRCLSTPVPAMYAWRCPTACAYVCAIPLFTRARTKDVSAVKRSRIQCQTSQQLRAAASPSHRRCSQLLLEHWGSHDTSPPNHDCAAKYLGIICTVPKQHDCHKHAISEAASKDSWHSSTRTGDSKVAGTVICYTAGRR